MKMTLSIPFMNQLQNAKGAIGSLRYTTSDETEWMVIDNNSTDPVEEFVRKYLKPKRLNYLRNNENLGMLKTLQQAYENCETEILALTHNDVFIYEKDWDQRVISYFKKMPDLGAVGFFGSQGCGPTGERIQDVPASNVMAGMGNMLEAEIHGFRLGQPWRSCAIFDGFMMIFRMEMLKKAGGFDQRYHYHHIYDRDISLESLRHGYKNIVVNVPCHHLCGLTANQSEYQDWIDNRLKNDGVNAKVGEDREGDIHHPTMKSADLWTHDENSLIFKRKWEKVLPLYVNDDFSFREGQQGQWGFKGDVIRREK